MCRGDSGIPGLSFPCSSVNLQMGYAVLQVTRTHILLVPTAPIRGIESRAPIAADSPNYWEVAWNQRSRLGRASGIEVSRDDVAPAVILCRRGHRISCTYTSAVSERMSARPSSATRLISVKAGPGFHSRSRGTFTGPGGSMATRLTPIRLNCWRRDCRRHGGTWPARHWCVGATFRDGQNGFYLLTRNSTVHKPAEGEASGRLQLRVVAKGELKEPVAPRSAVHDRGGENAIIFRICGEGELVVSPEGPSAPSGHATSL